MLMKLYFKLPTSFGITVLHPTPSKAFSKPENNVQQKYNFCRLIEDKTKLEIEAFSMVAIIYSCLINSLNNLVQCHGMYISLQ